MKNKTRVFSVVLALAMVFTMTLPFASAITPDISYYGSWVQLSKTYNNFSISKTGTASMTATTQGYGDSTKTAIEMYLERRVNGKWVEVSSWSDSDNSDYCGLSKTRAVNQGYEYRLRSVHTASGPRGTDTVEVISDSYWY